MGVVCTAQKKNNQANLTIIRQINSPEDIDYSQFRRERISEVGAIDGIPQMVFTNLPFQLSNPSTKSQLVNVESSNKSDESLGMAIRCLSIIPKSANEELTQKCEILKYQSTEKYSKTGVSRQRNYSKQLSDYSIRQVLDREITVQNKSPRRNLTVKQGYNIQLS